MKQITKYKWENWEPFLITRDTDGFTKIRLLENEISFRLGKKVCTGFYKDGKYNECPNQTQMEYGYNCKECRINDDFFLCIQCDGSNCMNEKQRNNCMKNNYFVYLAAFDNLLKVGVSFERRIMERLVEQGADFGAKIAFIQDGKNVRIVEQKIRRTLGITDRILGDEKMKSLFCDPNNCLSSIQRAINNLRNNGLNHCLVRPEIYDMRGYYKLHNVPVHPIKAQIGENCKIHGKVVAAKGNIIVLKDGKAFHSVNVHSIIGYQIEQLEEPQQILKNSE